MLHKTAKPKFVSYIKRGATILFAVELAAFAGSYYGWHKLNTDREFRLYMRDNYSSILEGYYTIGEKFGGLETRRLDSLYWKAQESKERV